MSDTSLAEIKKSIKDNHNGLSGFDINDDSYIDSEHAPNKKPNTYAATISSGYGKGDITIQVAFTESNPETCQYYDDIIAGVVSETNRSAKVVKTMAFKLGLELLKEYFTANNLFSQEVLDEIDGYHFEKQDTRNRIAENRAKALYQKGNPEQAQRYCERHGIDFAKVAWSYSVPVPERTDKTSQVKQWLNDFFADSNKPSSVEFIRKTMIEDKIIDNTDSDWSIVKGVASNAGYSKNYPRGVWGKVTS